MEEEGEDGVPDDAVLLRRVPPRHIDKTRSRPRAWKRDSGGKVKIESNAFTDSSDGDPMSCRLDVPGAEQALLDEVMDEAERSRCAIVTFRAKQARDLDLTVYLDKPDDDPSHVCVSGVKDIDVRNGLRGKCVVRREPMEPPL